jgi:hypothetical protein
VLGHPEVHRHLNTGEQQCLHHPMSS